MGAAIKDFRDLVVWRRGHELVVQTYRATRSFPKEELFGLTSQMRRCSVSITSNIAEGFGRFSRPDKNRFYTIAQGSTTELQNQLIVAKDVGLLKEDQFATLFNKSVEVHKMLTALIRGPSPLTLAS